LNVPSAFITAGARGVLVVGAIAGHQERLEEFLTAVIVRMQAGKSLSEVLRDERMRRYKNISWVQDIRVYQ